MPTLILSGAVDPATPPEWGEKVLKNLSNAVHLVAPGGHHIITGEGCIPQLIASFIVKGNAKGLDTRCTQSILPLAIHLQPSAAKKFTDAVKKSEDEKFERASHDSH